MAKSRGFQVVSRILPPRGPEGKVIPISLRLARGLVEELDAVAKESGYNRTEVIVQFLRFGLEEYRREAGAAKDTPPHK